MKKILTILLSVTISAAFLSGCNKNNSSGKTELEVGNWIETSATQEVKDIYDEKVKRFEEKYPDIKVIKGNSYQYDTKTFSAKAATQQLPTFLDVYFTELDMIMKNEYHSDITKALIDNKLLDKINPDLLSLLTNDKNEICGIPSNAYAQGLVINKRLFREAGLVDENGKPKVPETYDELSECARIIKEKTGIPGFVIPTIDNCGGWIFMNIAWSMGVTFEEQGEDGKWKASFDTSEFKKALQYIYDLKWKYDVFPEDMVLNNNDYLKVFGTSQSAMTITNPGPVNTFISKYGMNKDDIYFAKIPKGDAGRFSQMGGGAKVFFNANTEEENDAGVKWLMSEGYTPYIDAEAEKNLRQRYQKTISDGGVVFPKEIFSIWQSEERDKKIEEITRDYANVDMENYNDYYDFTGVTLKPEEPVCCQQLYSVLDNVIQEIVTNPDSDIESLTKTAVRDFQQNHLDKEEF